MMTMINNLWADIQIFISNYTYYYGMATNIALLVILCAFVIYGVIRTSKLPKGSKKRREINFISAEEETLERASKALSKAVKIPTISGDKTELDKLNGFLKETYPNVFKKENYAIMPSGSIIIKIKADIGSLKEPVLITGHTDVVPPVGEWKEKPFSGKDDGNFIWGRGAIDGKSTIIAQLEALESLIKEGYVPKRDLYFAYGSDEETGGEYGAAKIQEYFAKHNIKFEYILDEGGEINQAHLGNKNFPAAVVAVGEKASLIIKITAQGKANENIKTSPVGILSEAICRIEHAPMRRRLLPVIERFLKESSPALNYFERFCLANSKVMKPFLYLLFKDDRHISALFRTTFAVTQSSGSQRANILPDEASCIVNVRLLQGDTEQSVIKHLTGILGDLPIKIEALNHIEPSQISSTNAEGYENIRRTIEKHFGSVTVLSSLDLDGKDGKYYEKSAENVYRFSPFLLSKKQRETIHGSDENIKKEALGAAVEFYKSILNFM